MIHSEKEDSILLNVTEGRPDQRAILVVDDDAPVRESLIEFLLDEGHGVDGAVSGEDALEMIVGREYDLIITDLSMPGMDGFDLIRKAVPRQPLTPFIVLTGQGTVENAIQAIKMGAYDFITKPILDLASLRLCVDRGLERKNLLTAKVRYQQNLEDLIAEQTKELIDKNRELERKNRMLEDYTHEIESVSVSIIASMQTVLEEKDAYTAGHSRRVTAYASATAERLGFSGRRLWIVTTAAELHDIGKLIVDLSFINKPGPLSQEEWEIMRRHPETGDRFLAPFKFLADVRPLIRNHHERMDGSGYPDGISGDAFDLPTQVVAAADCFDAMTSRRSYRTPIPARDAVKELQSLIGVHFRAEVIEALQSAVLADIQGATP